MDSPPPEPRDSPLRDHGFLVACSANKTYAATVRWQDSTIMVLDLDSGTTLQSIDAGIEVFDIKMIDNIIFAVGTYELLSWRLEAGRAADVASVIRRATFSDTDLTCIGPVQLSVSFNSHHHQILSIHGNVCFLRHGEVVTQTAMQETIVWHPGFFREGLLVRHIREGRRRKKKSSSPSTPHTRSPSSEGRSEVLVPLTRPWALGLFLRSSGGYHITCAEKTHWVVDRGGRKLLWLPLHWRSSAMMWGSDILALVDGNFPEPIIVKFQ